MTGMQVVLRLDLGARAARRGARPDANVPPGHSCRRASLSPSAPRGRYRQHRRLGPTTLPRLGQLRILSWRRGAWHRRGSAALGRPLAAWPRDVRMARRADQTRHFRTSDLDGQADADARLVQHAGRGRARGGRLRLGDHPPATADAIEAAAELTARAFQGRRSRWSPLGPTSRRRPVA